MSSPAVSSTSTPLYRVFRGLKSAQIIPVPATEAEWLVTLNDFKAIYLAGRWKECETKCTRLLEAAKSKPVIYPYLLFLIGSCVEIHARNMHQYSAGKGSKIREAADWFENCEKSLPPTMEVPYPEPTTSYLLSTPIKQQGLGCDDSPSTAYGQGGDCWSFRQHEEHTPSKHCDLWTNRPMLSPTETSSLDLGISLPDEADPFVSLTPQSDAARERLDDWTIPAPPRLAPSPLRIRKVNTSTKPTDELPQYTTIPSPFSQASSKNGIAWSKGDEFGSPLRVVEVRDNQEADLYNYDPFSNSHAVSIWHNSYNGDDSDENHNFSTRGINDAINSTITPVPMRKGNSSTGDSGPHTTLQREDSSLWLENHRSSLKPLPLCIRPKKPEANPVDTMTSDRVSLAQLEHFWEISSFDGTYATNSDAQSLHMVQKTWPLLVNRYRTSRAAETERAQTLRASIIRYNNHLSFLSAQLQETVRFLRQLATDFDSNRITHIEARRIQPTKSYWSFAVKNNSGGTGDANPGDDYDEHRDKPEMKTNLGWAMPGTILNETKQERVKRLREGNFETVGMQNEKRGHKGRSWYLDLCEDVLDDIEGLMRGVY